MKEEPKPRLACCKQSEEIALKEGPGAGLPFKSVMFGMGVNVLRSFWRLPVCCVRGLRAAVLLLRARVFTHAHAAASLVPSCIV
jgi:hypothetical protein